MKITKCLKQLPVLFILILNAFLFINAISAFAGNLNYYYDAGNRLTYIDDQATGKRIAYKYDESGNRIQSIISDQKGVVTVDSNPDSVNAPWTLTGPNSFSASNNGDAVVGYLDPGNYIITWGDVTGWIKPVSETKNLVAGNSITFTGTYQPSSGTITIDPSPDSLTAPWIMTGPESFSVSFNGDAVVGYLTPGDYTVTWGDVAGWDKPYPVTQNLAAGDSILINGMYQLIPVVPIPPTEGIEGSDITLNGSNFGPTQGGGYVDFNGVNGAIISWSDTQIVVKVPACGATSGCLRIVTDYGTSACMDFVVKVGTIKKDLNADGIADILWRKESTGQVVLWYMNTYGTRSSYKTLLTDPAWTVVETDDFNADCIADILWRKESSGQVVLWFMNANGTRSSYKTLLTDPAWIIVATGDFNADGTADILWRKESTGQVVLWFMNANGTRSSYKTLLTDPAWMIVATGDFNADGIADILWRKASTGQVVLWFMNADGTRSSYKTLLTDPAWIIVATGDFNADGIADILWRKASTGQVVLWFMNADGTRSSYKTLLTDTTWTVVETDDFNADGIADILWRKELTGEVVLWFMSADGTHADNKTLIIDTEWTVVP